LYTLLREKSTMLSRDASILNDIFIRLTQVANKPTEKQNGLIKIAILWTSNSPKQEEICLAGTFNNWATNQIMKKQEGSSPIYYSNLVWR
jgi:hypothetical protein